MEFFFGAASSPQLPAAPSTAPQQTPGDDDLVTVEFTFDVPPGCQPGGKMQVTAPDGVALLIPVPMNAQGNDKVVMQRTDNGTWEISHLTRPDSPPQSDSRPAQQSPSQSSSRPSPVPQPDVQWRSPERLRSDLDQPGGVTVKLQTTKGPICLRICPSWAPKGARRFLQLVDHGFFDSKIAIYRAVSDFLVQFGVVKGGLLVDAIQDDPICGVPVEAGSVVFAAAGPDSRRHTLCIFLKGFPTLGRKPCEAPIGKVFGYSMDTLRSLYTGYGDIPQAGGNGPDPLMLEEQGNHYVHTNFPLCDFITSASRVQDDEDACTIA